MFFFHKLLIEGGADPGTNRVLSSNASGVSVSLQYDAAGNVTDDGNNTYLYDAEGRICAVRHEAVGGLYTMTQYLYDAEGRRVAKGSIASFSCDTTQNGFTATTVYVLGPGGEQLSELTSQSGTWQAVHTNVYAAGQQIATYAFDLSGQTTGQLYFHLSDWLGTRRQQTDYAGNPMLNFTGLPYGDGLSTITVSTAAAADATEHHFTGKERDSETGLDYFTARYYGSNIGRFMSADPLPWLHWQHGSEDDKKLFADFVANPQNLNMYSYVVNNPLSRTDPTGMSDLIFDGQAHTITLVSNEGQVVGTWRAGNNVAVHAPPGEGGGAYTHGPIQDGKYEIAKGDQHGATTHLNGSADSAYGSNGIVHIPGAKGATGDTLQGAGVHSGREDKGGPDAKTAGCIRTTDEAMSTINATAKSDPLKTITVQNNGHNVQQWKATADAVKKKEGQQ